MPGERLVLRPVRDACGPGGQAWGGHWALPALRLKRPLKPGLPVCPVNSFILVPTLAFFTLGIRDGRSNVLWNLLSPPLKKNGWGNPHPVPFQGVTAASKAVGANGEVLSAEE